MESLSPECTPLKHRYDSCFNAWFEGYLQPALASASSSSSSSSTPTPAPVTPTTPPIPTALPSEPTQPSQSQRKPLITSWSSAFPPRRLFARKSPTTPSSSQAQGQVVEEEEHHWYDFALSEPEPESEVVMPVQEEISAKGKTRAQVKAEEYQRNCGKFWEDYQGCLKNAINQNESLSALLETAREEHPLGSLDGLKGTPWDSKADFAKEQE